VGRIGRLGAAAGRLSPAQVGLVAAALALAFAVLRLVVAADGDVSRFVVAGDTFVDRSAVERTTGASLHVFPSSGYDGQFFWRVAVAPGDWRPGTHHGVEFDNAYRAPRIGYPLLAHLVSGGRAGTVASALVAVNVAAVGAIGYGAGRLARAGGHPAAWGLTLTAGSGLVMGLARDLAEPVTVACLVGGLAALVQRRPVLATALWSAAVLTREQALISVAGYAVWRLASLVRGRARARVRSRSGAAQPTGPAGPGGPEAADRPAGPPRRREPAGPRGHAAPAGPAVEPVRLADLPWLVPTLVFVGWQAILWRSTGEVPATAAGGTNVVPPFTDLVPGLAHWATGDLPRLHAVAPLQLGATVAVVVVAAQAAPRVPAAHRYVTASLVLATAAATCLAASIWRDPSDMRHLIDVWVLGWAVLLLADRPPPRWAALLAAGVCAATVAARVVAI